MKSTTIGGIVAVLVVVSLPIGFLARLAWDVRRSIVAVKARHAEASSAVRFVYEYRDLLGIWPTPEIVEASATLPPSWEYHVDALSPVLWLHGPYHMSVSYRFATPPREPTREWEFCLEGDDAKFTADADYHPHARAAIVSASQNP
jgi:hypothetical protein